MKRLNWPNLLTLSRFGFSLLIMALISLSFPYSKTLALLVFIAASITDYLDGHLARNVYGTTSFGKLMDALADKVMICAVLVSFVELRLPYSPGPFVPAFLVVIIIFREFAVTGLRLLAANNGIVISAGKWGKHKTVWQITALIILLLGLAVRYDLLAGMKESFLKNYDLAFHIFSWFAMAVICVVTLASGVHYFTKHRNLILGNV